VAGLVVRVAAVGAAADVAARAVVVAGEVRAVDAEVPVVAAGAKAPAVRDGRAMAKVATADEVMDAVATAAASSSRTSLRSIELPRS